MEIKALTWEKLEDYLIWYTLERLVCYFNDSKK